MENMVSLFEPELETHQGIKDEYKLCNRCPLDQRRTGVVFWDGPNVAPCMVIGEAPGKDEDAAKRRRPFIGRAGQRLNSLFHHLDIDRSKIHISNAVLCRPTDGIKNLKPTWEEIKICNQRLKAEIRLTQPKVIVTLGQPGTVAVLGPRYKATSMTKLRGWHKHTYVYNGMPVTIPVMASWHPAYELRARGAGRTDVTAEMARDWRSVVKRCPDILKS